MGRLVKGEGERTAADDAGGPALAPVAAVKRWQPWGGAPSRPAVCWWSQNSAGGVPAREGEDRRLEVERNRRVHGAERVGDREPRQYPDHVLVVGHGVLGTGSQVARVGLG